MLTVLNNHNSTETAHVVDDYPYGFRLRCKIRYHIERNSKGMRFVSQTTNPKITGREVWNKPKASTYSDLMVMVRDESNGYINQDSLHFSSGPSDFARFKEAYYGQLTEADRMIYDTMEARSRHFNPNSSLFAPILVMCHPS